MSGIKSNTKQDKQFAVSVAILEVIEKEGLHGVTHSKVARKSKVSRAWIYEYIGKEKSTLVEYAAEVLASHFARARLTDLPKTKEELVYRLKEGTDFLFTSTSISPVAIKIYFAYRGSDNPLGKVIQKNEKQWLGTATKTLNQVLKIPSEQAATLAELMLILRLGFAHRFTTSKKPQESQDSAKQVFSYLQGMLSAAY